jgi:hypothetical protein
VKVVNKEPIMVEMADGQTVVMVPKVMLLVQAEEDSLVSLLATGRLLKLSSWLAQAAVVVTKPEELVVEILEVTLWAVLLMVLLNLLEAPEVKELTVPNTLVVTETLEVSKTLKPLTAEVVELVTSVVKAVALMLEVVLVVQDSAVKMLLLVFFNKVLKEKESVRVPLLLHRLVLKVTSLAAVKVDKMMVLMVAL